MVIYLLDSKLWLASSLYVFSLEIKIKSYLSSDSVGSSGEKLGDTSSLETGFSETEGSL